MKCRFPLMTLGLAGVLFGPCIAAPDSAPPVAAPEKVPVTLSATLTKQKFDADEPVDLTVTLVNKSDKTIFLGSSSDKFSWFDIKVTSGKAKVAHTAFYEHAFTPMDMPRSNIQYRLPPQGTERIIFPLRRLFDLSAGGDFSVDINRTFIIVGAAPAGDPNGARPYRRELEVAPTVSFSVAPPPDIQQELIP